MSRQRLPTPEEMANYRAKKAGIALHIQKKAEQRYNEEESIGTPERVMVWMNNTLNGDHPPCNGSTFRKLQFFLRDGTALCKFINKLRTEGGLPAVKYQKNSTTPFVAMENIELFNKAAEEYGLPHEAMFQSADLYEGQSKGNFLTVINCLNKLGFVANEKGFSPQYEAVQPPERDTDLWAGK